MANFSIRAVLLIVFAVEAFSSNVEVSYVTVDTTTGRFLIHDAEVTNWIAKGEFVNSINETGWSYLSVTTRDVDGSPDADQAYAAGLVEGHLTRDLITMHWINTVKDQFCEEPFTPECRELKSFLDTNMMWMLDLIAKNQDDPYWHQVALFLTQVDGLNDGYFKNPGKPSMDVDPFGLFVLSLSGDMEDIPSALSGKDWPKRVVGSGSCSALIKLLPGNSDIFVAHDTWSSFQTMLRVLKKYDFAYHYSDTDRKPVPGAVMTFSSYPGVLLSGDDFYLISSGLASQETTIGNSNPDLNKNIIPNSVLEGVRTMVANRLAVNGKDWAQTFTKFNSGTYNNQWMVVDFNKFQAGATTMPGLLTVLEQIPGMIVWDDLTETLMQQSYWPSYNIAFFPEIFNLSGGPESVKRYGDWFSYSGSPRAKIFKRDNGKVKDLQSMQNLMRYNDFQNDPLSRCNCTPPFSGENAISARSDLNPANGTYPFGALSHRSHRGTDMKVTSSKMFKRLEFIAISGPTYDQLPPFSWSTADFSAACPHVGHPDVFKFDPISFNGTFHSQRDGTVVHKFFKG